MLDNLTLYMVVWFAIGIFGSVAYLVEYVLTKGK
tara:strand:+ start:231 stop:332 length:102 start_codon:yes stop_codon:yes gene_type:complete